MFRRSAAASGYLAMPILAITLVACGGKDERIEGTVLDPFGNPIAEADVKVQKSTFTARTDRSGKYSLDYAPGALSISFSKPGYTTQKLELNIQQKSHYPAEPMVLYEIPKDGAIYYVDGKAGKYVQLSMNCKILENKRDSPGFSLTRLYQFSAIPLAGQERMNPTLVAGKLTFIDKVPQLIGLAQLRKGDTTVLEADLNMFERRDKYFGLVKDQAQRIGDEGLLVRTVELKPASYAWLPLVKTDMIGLIPKREEPCAFFSVVDK
jgi:hypothetical protein